MSERARNEREEELGYGKWLFRNKGTAAEPWPTAEELWHDPDVKSAIEAHNKIIEKRMKKNKSIKQRNGS